MDEKDPRKTTIGDLDTVGYEDLNIPQLRKDLLNAYEKTINQIELSNIELNSIYICGSYASNEALESASDLDVRYVITGKNITKEILVEFRDTIQKIWTEEYTDIDEDLFMILDAWIANKPPEPPSKKLYNK